MKQWFIGTDGVGGPEHLIHERHVVCIRSNLPCTASLVYTVDGRTFVVNKTFGKMKLALLEGEGG